MTVEYLSDAMGLLADDLIEEADRTRNTKTRTKARWKWGALAACLCVVVLGAVWMLASDKETSTEPRPVLQWSEGFAAADYFAYSGEEESGSSSSLSLDAAPPYDAQRSFSDDREQLEAEGVIPPMEGHPLFDCTVGYLADGSIYSVQLLWLRYRDDAAPYSHLSVTAGYQEIEMVEDCISIELDAEGNIVPEAVTVTERDGVRIVAEGSENRGKTLTFQNEHGWYQITGSASVSYEDVVYLLDWLWEHPLDFFRFSMERGDAFEYMELSDAPDAFQGYIPDFESMGYAAEQESLLLKNGGLYSFEGHYLKANTEQGVGEETNIWWCIKTEPDYYDRQAVLGSLEDLTGDMIADALGSESSVAFLWDGCFIRVYTKSPQALWTVLESLSK